MREESLHHQELQEYQSYLLVLANTQVERLVDPAIDPHDVVQQTLTKAHAARHQFRGRTSRELAGWLRAILANHLKDLFRRNGHQLDEQALAHQLEQSSARLGSILHSEGPTPSQALVMTEKLQQLSTRLVNLPEDQRRAIELRYLQGLTVAEITEQMQRSVRSIAGLLHRGLTALREDLSELR